MCNAYNQAICNFESFFKKSLSHCPFSQCVPSPANMIMWPIREVINRFKLNATVYKHKYSKQISLEDAFLVISNSVGCPLQSTRNTLHHHGQLGQPYVQLCCGMFHHSPCPLHCGVPAGMNLHLKKMYLGGQREGRREEGEKKENGDYLG